MHMYRRVHYHYYFAIIILHCHYCYDVCCRRIPSTVQLTPAVHTGPARTLALLYYVVL